jgi:tetratricopeptide (TPR) repeat protein
MLLTQNTQQDIEGVYKQIDEWNKHSYEERNHDPKLSFEYAAKAREFSERINYLKGKADALNNFGFYYLQITEHEKCLEFLVEALQIQIQIGNETGIANTEYNLAALQIRYGNFTTALDALHKCIAIRAKQNDKAGLALCYFQMVYINERFEHYDEGIEIGKKALEIRKELNDRIGIAALLTQMGCIYRKKKEYDISRKFLEEALEMRSSVDEIRGYFATVFQWVDLCIEIGKLQEAKKYALIGMTAASGEKEWFGVMRFHQQLGKIAMEENEPEEAKKFFSDALRIAEEKKFKSITYEVSSLMAELYEKLGDHKTALEYYKKFHTLKEEVLTAQSSSQLKGIQLMNQIESSKREAELERVKNVDLKNAFKLIEEKNKEILDSMHYASRIQRALLPTEFFIDRNLNKNKDS